MKSSYNGLILFSLDMLWFLQAFLQSQFGVSKMFSCFSKEVSYAPQGCIYLTKNTVITVILWNINTILNNLVNYILKCNYSWDSKAEFSTASTAVFSVTWSSEIILICWLCLLFWFCSVVLSRTEKSSISLKRKTFVTLEMSLHLEFWSLLNKNMNFFIFRLVL